MASCTLKAWLNSPYSIRGGAAKTPVRLMAIPIKKAHAEISAGPRLPVRKA